MALTVEMLQREIEGVQDRLLAAEEIEVDEVDSALAALGFTKAAGIKEAEEAKKRNRGNEELKKLARYYRQAYPTYRFLDYGSVERICEKYGLYVTEVGQFTGGIPDGKKREILDFRVKRRDVHVVLPGDFLEYMHSKLMYDIRDVLDKEEYIQGNELRIMAPEDQIDTSGLEKRGYEFVVEDPVVLQPVQGGYLVVAAWGPEAEDVADPKSN